MEEEKEGTHARTMSHIIYIHVNVYHVLQDIGLRFDPRYEVTTAMQPIRDHEHHLTTFRVSVSRRDGVKDGFYGEHIRSLTAIVGNNGAGKTTALRFLLEAVVSGAGHDISGFIITEDENGALRLHHSEDVRVEINANGLNVQQEREWPEIDTFVYGGHVNILSSVEDIMSVELAGMVNATEGNILTADLQHYGRELATNGIFSLRDYATAYDAQNQWRICNFLSQYDGPLKQQLHLPNYLLIVPNKAGQWSLKHRIKEEDRIDYPDYTVQREWTFRENRLAEMVYYNIINYISDDIGEHHHWQGFLDAWQKMLSEQYKGDVVSLYRLFVDSRQLPERNEYRIWLEYIYEVIENINVHCQFDEGSLLHYFYFRIDDGENAMQTFLGWLQGNPIFITSRYFDLRYAHDNDSGSLLSSGEKAMLDMYSRIYDTLITKHQFNSNYRWPTLFVFDEAEIGFHPEWQRQYVKNITVFLEVMAAEASGLIRERYHNQPDFKYQIILSSHSPIIISDVPSECTVMLRRDIETGRTENVAASRKQTFGTNVFELYRDSFFMEGGLVGEFAMEYIREVSRAIERLNQQEQQPAAEELESLRKRVELIGDESIKSYLLLQLGQYDRQSLIAYHQEQINRLQHE